MPSKMRESLPYMRAPDSIGWETTLRCNMRCRHCGSTAGDARKDELDNKQALALCKQFVKMRVGRVVFTGGETLLRPDWRQLGETILEGGVDLGLLSNGWVFERRVLKELKSFCGTSFHVLVSLDGTAKVHDKIRGIEGSFERAYRGTAELIAAGIPCGIITTVHHTNIGTLPKLREQILFDLKPYVWQLQITTPFGRAHSNADCSVSPTDYVKLSRFIAQTRKLARGTGCDVATGDCVGYLGKTELALRDSPWEGCQAGKMILGIQSNGNVKGCLSIIDDRFIEGNAIKDGLEKIWNKRGAFAYTRNFKVSNLKGECRKCSEGKACHGGCSASSISVFGTPHHAPYCLRVMERDTAKRAAK